MSKHSIHRHLSWRVHLHSSQLSSKALSLRENDLVQVWCALELRLLLQEDDIVSFCILRDKSSTCHFFALTFFQLSVYSNRHDTYWCASTALQFANGNLNKSLNIKKMQEQGDTATMHTVKQDLTDHPGVPGDPRFRRQFATWPMHETELITAVTETRCISWDALVPRQPEWVPHSGICSPFLKVKGALLWNKWYLDKQLLMTSASVTVSSIWRHHKGDRLTSATLQNFCKLRPEPLKIAASVVLAEFQSSDCVPKLAKFGMFAELFFYFYALTTEQKSTNMQISLVRVVSDPTWNGSPPALWQPLQNDGLQQ